MFRFNPGQNKKVFPPKNSYTKIVGANIVKKEVEKKFGKQFEKNRILTKPRKEQFNKISKNVYVHELVNKIDDYNELVSLSTEMSKNGKVTEILPEIDAKNVSVRNVIFPNYKKGLKTNPDLKNGNTYYDLKRPKAIKNILGNANKASKQGCIAIISDSQLDKPINDNIMFNRAKHIFKSKNYKYDVVIFKRGSKLDIINRKDIN